MNYKKLYVLSLFLLLSACSITNSSTTNNTSNSSSSSNTSISEISIDTTEHNYVFNKQDGDNYIFSCNHCNEEKIVTITYVSGTNNIVEVNNNTITFSNVLEETTYSISGELYGNIVINTTYKFELELNGFSLTSSNECPINVTNEKAFTLSSKKDTQNYIYDLRNEVSEEDISSSIYVTNNLNLQGKGELYVKSLNNNGIHAKDDLKIKNLTLQVECVDNALKGNDLVEISSGNINLISTQGDGIKTSNSSISSKGNQKGNIHITGGNINIYAACDGLDSSYDTIIDETSEQVNLNIYTDKYSPYSKEVTATSSSTIYIKANTTSYKYSIKYINDTSTKWYNSSSYESGSSFGGRPQERSYYYPIIKPSGYDKLVLYVYSTQEQGQDNDYLYASDTLSINSSYDTISYNNNRVSWTNKQTSQFGPGGMNEGNQDKGDYSTKGIKADNEISIINGNITIQSYDDSLHANNDVTLENGSSPLGNITISGGNLTLSSNDDAIHADNKVTISSSTINILTSYEGIEGNNVEILSGNIYVISSDDGINGTATSGEAIIFRGGNIYIFASGDGIDSNSQTSYDGILFEGSNIVVISNGRSDSSIDTEKGYKYTGGNIIGIGLSGGMSNESTKVSNFSSIGKSTNLNLVKDNFLIVENIVNIKMPVSMNAFIVCLGNQNQISTATNVSSTLDNNGICWLI